MLNPILALSAISEKAELGGVPLSLSFPPAMSDETEGKSFTATADVVVAPPDTALE